MTDVKTVGDVSWYEEERPRLVRLCQAITGRPDAAEDLAQETLAEAWRLRARLTDPAGADRWLSAIARNICRRWIRAQGREQTRWSDEAIDLSAVEEGWELEVELEREELAGLLDRALALLTAETRSSLVARYVEELAQAEIAERLRISEGAVAMRLQRGRLALRRVLATDLRDEAAAYGLAQLPGATWQETRIWCPICGQRRLSGRSMAATGEFRLRCFGCFPAGRDQQVLNIAHTRDPEMAGAAGWKAPLSRVMSAFDAYFAHAVAERRVPCAKCGHTVALRQDLAVGIPQNAPEVISSLGLHVRCERCGETADIHPLSLALFTPAGRDFWRRHPRLRMLPERTVEAQGRPAVVERFESVLEKARLDVILARGTYEVLGIYQSPPA